MSSSLSEACLVNNSRQFTTLLSFYLLFGSVLKTTHRWVVQASSRPGRYTVCHVCTLFSFPRNIFELFKTLYRVLLFSSLFVIISYTFHWMLGSISCHHCFRQLCSETVAADCSQHAHCSVAQVCPTLCGPMDCSAPGSSVHGILQARILKWVAIPFSRIFPTQGSNLGLLHCRRMLYHLSQ